MGDLYPSNGRSRPFRQPDPPARKLTSALNRRYAMVRVQLPVKALAKTSSWTISPVMRKFRC